MDKLGKYSTKPFKKSRLAILDHLSVASKKKSVSGIIEVDITDARIKIQQISKETGNKLSFTAWLLVCIGEAVAEYPNVHSYMKGRHKIITFEDVDCSILVEKNIKGHLAPMPLVIRKINKKNIFEVSEEIRNAQSEKMDRGGVMGDKKSDNLTKLYPYLPGFIRRFIYKKLTSNPFFIKKYMGTIVLTSIGMFGQGSGWPLISSVHNLSFGVGGISKKIRPKKNGDISDFKNLKIEDLEVREILNLSIFFDHEVLDGGPAARFTNYLVKCMESAFGL